MELLDLCRKMIAVNSVTVPNGTKELVNVLLPIFTKLGCRTKTQSFLIEGHENLNVLASIGPQESRASLLINTHLDTVAPGPLEAWTLTGHDPFRATIHDGYLIGLGAADTKLAMACVLIALERVLERKPAKFWREALHIMGAAGEEHGLLGTHYALKHDFVRAQYALDSEPSELNPVWAHKGIAVAKISLQPQSQITLEREEAICGLHFQGTAAHSSTPHLGDNALDKALQFVEQLLSKNATPAWAPCFFSGGTAANVIPAEATVYFRGHGKRDDFELFLKDYACTGRTIDAPHSLPAVFPLELFQAASAFHRKLQQVVRTLAAPQNQDFTPSFATTSLTVARASNHTPLTLEFLTDHRFINVNDHQHFFKHLATLAADLSPQFPQVKITVELERANQPMQGKKDSFLVKTLSQILKQIGLPAVLKTKAGCTEGALFAAHGMECVVIGPGVGENNIHKPNERVALTQLEQAVTLYEKTIEHFCV